MLKHVHFSNSLPLLTSMNLRAISAVKVTKIAEGHYVRWGACNLMHNSVDVLSAMVNALDILLTSK